MVDLHMYINIYIYIYINICIYIYICVPVRSCREGAVFVFLLHLGFSERSKESTWIALTFLED